MRKNLNLAGPSVRKDEQKRERVEFDVRSIVIKRKLKSSDDQEIIFLKAFMVILGHGS